MSRIKVPTPPSHSKGTHCLEQLGLVVGHIWIFTDKGAAAIETQYKNFSQIQEALQVSRSTAYRIIARHPVRYWCIDLRHEDKPRCYCVLPTDVVNKIEKHPVGNPNFANGIYQQTIARRLRTKKH